MSVPNSFPAAVLYLAEGSPRRAAVVERLAQSGVIVSSAPALSEALPMLEATPFALCLVDLAANGAALAAVRSIRARQPHLPIAGLFDPGNVLAAADAIDAGAVDVLPWPFDGRAAATLLANARERVAIGAEDAAIPGDDLLVMHSPAMQPVAERIDHAGRVRANVCVTGEPGSGRTMAGQTIHRLGDAGRTATCVVEDCAQAPQDLERRLFGDTGGESAAAAGPDRLDRDSAVARARGGTLLLRHLVDAPARVQGRLARLLRDREAVLTSGHAAAPLDIRVIATLEPDVDAALAEGRLRPDLLRQLAQIRIDVPALRRRREDIPVLAVHLLRASCRDAGVPPKSLSRAALQLLAALPWTGNAGELRRLLDAMAVAVPGPVVQLEHVLERASLAGITDPVALGATLREAKERFERDCISAVLMRHHGRVPEAAKALGIQRTNLYRRIRQLNVARSLLAARR